MIAVHHHEDGYAYWMEGEDLWAAPDYVTGGTDIDNAMLVEDFDEPLTGEVLDGIRAKLGVSNV